MPKIVEQVDVYGNIVMGYDHSLSTSKIFEVLKQNFPNIYKDEDNMICGEYDGRGYAIRIKNITYLGHPHPLFKKRIQITNDLQSFYQNAKRKGKIPLLMGVYTYEDNLIFCDFSIDDFINKRAHNSSAHIYTENIADATIDGYFEKEDHFGNHITAFSQEGIKTFLEEKVRLHKVLDSDSSKQDVIIDGEEQSQQIIEKTVMPEEIRNMIISFFDQEKRHWFGIDCYNAMISADYRNKFQPEWPGFYLEFEFERYLEKNNLTPYIQYAQDKTKGGIDLDLYFPTIQMYGDLKAHSSQSKGIQGNDWNTVMSLITDTGKDNHIYYVVCEHETKKDADKDYEVTYFWNKIQNKSNLMSYHRRMKNSVELTKAYILDINQNNVDYLSKFKQGINSNGRPREPKIMIDHDKISNFLLEKIDL